ncbi:colicin E3/pyocin S6 family cytotoxin [Sporosarcina psychrophila]|uniref:Colicin E3-like ribonuclease domain-containing protein n=1 Tax=Sporosarcina psychrophila TaxID=1476 RepID=A0ABV2KGD9_SPOPS
MVILPKPSILDAFKVNRISGGRKVWQSDDGRFFTWDSLHGEIEVYNKRGRHIAVLHPQTGEKIKDAVKGRKIDV